MLYSKTGRGAGMTDKTVRDRIIAAMKVNGRPMAEQDFGYMGTNSSGVTRELRRMKEDGLVTAKRRYDPLNGVLKKYKEWELIENPVSKEKAGTESSVPGQPQQQELFK